MNKTKLLMKLLFAMFLLVPVRYSLAASLYLSPSSGEYPVSSPISVKVMVESSGQAINAIDSTIAYPADMLEAKSVLKSGSILALWPKEPVFSGSEVSFSGGVPSPGFTGTGSIITITFIAKKEGNAIVSIAGGMVLAADGRGTNVLERKSGSSFKIVSKGGSPIAPTSKKEEVSNLPIITEISSTTHPNQDVWYNNSNPTFTWKSTADTTGLSYELYKEKDKAVSDLVAEESVFSKTYSNVESGIWQFHIRARNSNGWGRDAFFKINIDKDAPDPFDIKIDNYGDTTSPQVSLYFETKDDLSGIDHYEMKIDDNGIISIEPSKTNPFVMPIQLPGSHKVSISAVDEANNKREGSAMVNVESIEVPEITVHPDVYNAGEEVLYIEGRSIPNASVTIFIEKDGNVVKEWEIKPDEKGSWSLGSNDLFRSGNYKIFAKARDQRGAVSDPSEKHPIKIILKGVALGPWFFDYWTFSWLLLLLILLLVIILLYICHKIRKDKKKIDKETREAEESLKKTFKKIRDDLEKKIEYLDSKPGLSAKEKKIRDEIFKMLKDSEREVYKEIKDIEDEL